MLWRNSFFYDKVLNVDKYVYYSSSINYMYIVWLWDNNVKYKNIYLMKMLIKDGKNVYYW